MASSAAAPLSQALHDVAMSDTVVPDAYVWPAHELHHVPHDQYADDEIPVIDLQQSDRSATLRSVRDACGSWGFFQAVNHGVPAAVVERMQAASKQFFDLPLETKELLVARFQDDRVLGYGFPEGSSKRKASRRMWSEGLYVDDVRVAGFAAVLWPADEDEHARNEFRATVEEYLAAMSELGVRLFRLIVESLGVDSPGGRFAPKEPGLLRLNHYPPCPDPSVTTGLIPHHDANLITILHQGAVGGLQVWRDAWVALRPHPNAFAVNAGNMLQVISNDMCSSALHRAVVNKSDDRYSLAYFVQAPAWDQISPLPELLDEDCPAKYRPFTWPEYLTTQLKNVTHGLAHFAV